VLAGVLEHSDFDGCTLILMRYGIKSLASDFHLQLQMSAQLLRLRFGADADDLLSKTIIDYGCEVRPSSDYIVVLHPLVSMRFVSGVDKCRFRRSHYGLFGGLGGGFGGFTVPFRRAAGVAPIVKVRAYAAGWWHRLQCLHPPKGVLPPVVARQWHRAMKPKMQCLVDVMSKFRSSALTATRFELRVMGLAHFGSFSQLDAVLSSSLGALLPHTACKLLRSSDIFTHMRLGLSACEVRLWSDLDGACEEWKRRDFARLANRFGVVHKLGHEMAWAAERADLTWGPAHEAAVGSAMRVPVGFNWDGFPVLRVPPRGDISAIGVSLRDGFDVDALMDALHWPRHVGPLFLSTLLRTVWRRTTGRMVGAFKMLAAYHIDDGRQLANLGAHVSRALVFAFVFDSVCLTCVVSCVVRV
jgi:hypothetical protein